MVLSQSNRLTSLVENLQMNSHTKWPIVATLVVGSLIGASASVQGTETTEIEHKNMLLSANGATQQAVASIKALSLTYAGYSQRGVDQGYWIDDVDQRQRLERFLSIDFGSGKYFDQFKFAISGTSYYQLRYQRDETGGWVINPHPSVKVATPSDEPELKNGFFQVVWPWLLLRNIALGHTELAYAGQIVDGDKPYQTFTSKGGQAGSVMLYADANSYKISRLDLVANDTTWRTYRYFDYKLHAGITLPQRIERYQNGKMDRRISLLRASNTVEQADFDLLKTSHKIEDPAPNEMKVVEIAPGYYLVGRASYKTLYVDFGSYYAAFDMGPSSENAAAGMDAFRAAVADDKPLKYAVLSHHHIDHRGGLSTFIDAGATIVLTDKSLKFLEKQALWVEGTPVLVLPDGGSLDIGTTERPSLLTDIGKYNDHAESLLIAWFEREKLLFQADLLDFPNSGPYGQRFPNIDTLLAILKNLGLEPELYANAHMRHGTKEDLAKILRNSP